MPFDFFRFLNLFFDFDIFFLFVNFIVVAGDLPNTLGLGNWLGGGIFDLLPISNEKDIMPIISSPHKANFEFTAKQFDLPFARVESVKDLCLEYKKATQAGELKIIEAVIDNEVNKNIYKILKTVRLN